jgi:hypothetical protein
MEIFNQLLCKNKLFLDITTVFIDLLNDFWLFQKLTQGHKGIIFVCDFVCEKKTDEKKIYIIESAFK